MESTQMPSCQQTLGALVVAASKNILQTNTDFAQGSSTEDTVADESSDTSQNSPDQTPDASISTNIQQFTSSLILSSKLERPHSLPHKVVSNTITQLQNGFSPVLHEDGAVKKRDHKKRSKNWIAHETEKLIRARTDLDERFRNSGRKAPLWEEIAQTLQKADVSRDGQQCKDKWEKLTASYKEVREGARDKDDLPFYNEIHQILSNKLERKENGMLEDGADVNKRDKRELGNDHVTPNYPGVGPYRTVPECNVQNEEFVFTKKRKRDPENFSLTDISVVQELLETILSTQQQLFKNLLDAVEKKECMREQIRQQREDIWRAEERAHRYTFNNTMIILIQKLLGERPPGVATTVSTPTVMTPTVLPTSTFGSSKKRSKNWKRTEVYQLIHVRKEMEDKFARSSRRAGLWEEVGSKLASLSIKRDGKQCREKWDKLMAGYKDVVDGKREKDESPYYTELCSYMEMIKESKNNPPVDVSNEELVAM
ncbi:hypothetical protein KP509_21G042300 [Ceratopteris richardii]|uniref:Myb-like domain-containing protein n=2 Tax=Ceratopteris richardii TaxID=49495 RepID=A0A8T2SC76_CERRI|nr:hypothetical protein KP509_21G042300 [Ceratopteris richardii]